MAWYPMTRCRRGVDQATPRPVQTEPFGQDTLMVVKSTFTRMRAKARPCLARPTAWTPRRLQS
jgi:hypothetical protein